MTDSTESIEQEPASIFSRALLWRILAVGLFVALGTFAVVQSLNAKPDADQATTEVDADGNKIAGALSTGDATTQANATGDSGVLDSIKSSVAKVTTPTASTGAIAGLRKLSSAGAPKKNSTRSLPGSSFAKANTTLKPGRLGLNPSSSSRTNVAKPTSGFSSTAKQGQVIAAKPPTQIGGTTTSPATSSRTGFKANTTVPSRTTLQPPPPKRFAQLGDTPASQFAATSQTAAPAIKKPLTSAASPFQNVSTRAAQGLGDLKAGAAAKTNELLNSAKQSATQMTNSAKSQLGQFGNSIPKVEAKPPTSSSSPFSIRGNTTPQTTSTPSSPFSTQRNSSSSNVTTRNNQTTTMQPVSKATTTPGQTFGSRPSSTTPATSGTGSPFSMTNNQRGAASQTPPTRNPINTGRPATRSNTGTFGSTGNTANTSTQINRAPSTRTPAVLPGQRTNSAPVVSVSARNTPGDRAFEGVQAPALTIEKVSPREVQVNQTADFEIIVKNVGRVVANEVRVLDKVPAGTQFVGSTPEPDSLSRTGDLQWSLGGLRPGQEKRLKFQLKPTQPGEIGSVAQVVFAAQASMRTNVTKPELEIRHSTSPRVLIGDNVVFDVVVENKGDGPARNVIIQEEIPMNLEFADGSPEIEYEVGTLMPGQSRNVQLRLRAAKIGKLRNIMFASAAGGLQARHELDMEVVAPDLKTTSDGPTRRFLQREATHRFSIENGGTAKATNVELFARLPSGLRFVSANNRGKYDSNTHSVVWVMPTLSQGAAGTVELTTMPVEAGEQNIKFESFADLGLKSETKQQLTVEHLIDVFFDIDDVVDPIEVGAGTSYRIRVLNQGTKTATNVRIKLDFPPGLQPTDVDGNLRNQINGQTVLFEPISTMRPGDELGVTVRATGKSAGDHRVVVNMQTDGRTTPVSKEETTRVYTDR